MVANHRRDLCNKTGQATNYENWIADLLEYHAGLLDKCLHGGALSLPANGSNDNASAARAMP